MSRLSSQSRPDLAYDALNLSTILNKASAKDAKESRKAAIKAKTENFPIKYSHLGDFKDLHIEVFADASFANIENGLQTKSVMGSTIYLANKELRVNPIQWKSKVIEKVTPDTKTAETLALENAIDDAIHLSEMISEVYTGEIKGGHQIPLIVREDSKALIQSLYSTHKVKRKTMWVIISCIQQHIQTGIIKDIFHVKSNQQLADVFTKKGVNTQTIIETMSSGIIDFRL